MDRQSCISKDLPNHLYYIIHFCVKVGTEQIIYLSTRSSLRFSQGMKETPWCFRPLVIGKSTPEFISFIFDLFLRSGLLLMETDGQLGKPFKFGSQPLRKN